MDKQCFSNCLQEKRIMQSMGSLKVSHSLRSILIRDTTCVPKRANRIEFHCETSCTSPLREESFTIPNWRRKPCEPGSEYNTSQYLANEVCSQEPLSSVVETDGNTFEASEDESKTRKFKKRVNEAPEEPNWRSLPDDIQGSVFKKLKFEDLFQMKVVSKGMKNFVESPAFLSSRGNTVLKEGLLTSLYFSVDDGALQWSGYDLISKKWRPLPTLACLPSPDIEVFKEYLVSAGGGLLCANVSKSVQKEELILCNPMTQTSRVLPPLNFPRNPVLMHILANPKTNSYKIIVTGSAGMTDGHILSRKTEVFDSLTFQWEVTDDLPGSEFSLNEYQTGVCINGILYCIAFLEDGSGKGVLAYNVEKGEWLSDWKCPIPCGPGHASITQLVECDGEVYLFTEHEAGRTLEHRIDKLVVYARTISGGGSGKWENVLREPKSGGRGLLVYPEFACVGFGAGKLCIFNTIECTGKVYNLCNGGHSDPLPAREGRRKGRELFHSLNPLSFAFEPNFQSTV